jgi:hypothetical protein
MRPRASVLIAVLSRISRPSDRQRASREWVFFYRLSFATLIIGVFWMVVQLQEYIIWLRSGEKALLLLAIIGSCTAIYVNERICSDLKYLRREFLTSVYWVSTIPLLVMLVLYLIYLCIGEPSPISLQLPEVPGPRRLKLEGAAIIFLILAPLYGAVAYVHMEAVRRYLPISIIVFCVLCLVGRMILFIYYACGDNFLHTLPACHGPGIWDIGATTLRAIHAVRNGINPYATVIQDWNPTFPGYTYWPMMIATYMPLTYIFDQGAIRLTNFALDVITGALIAVLVGRRSGWQCGTLAASLYFMLPLLPQRLYLMADTDLAPTVLLVAALAMYQTRPGLAGVMVGLSVASKFLPGIVMLLCCFPDSRRSRYVGGFVLGCIPAIAFCLLDPSDFIYSTVWSVVRTPFDGSSWLYGAPFYIVAITRLAFVLLMAAVAVVIIWRRPNLFERCALYVICVVAVLLVAHAHNNYMLWWIPFFCIVLSLPLRRILSLEDRRTAWLQPLPPFAAADYHVDLPTTARGAR